MVTKNDERKALEQIKEIVFKLGDDSYLSTAFEGCFEIAFMNIENDFFCSMKQKYEQEHEQVVKLLKTVNEQNDDCFKMEKRINDLEKEIKAKDKMLEHDKSMKVALKKELDEADKRIEHLESCLEEKNKAIVKYGDELVHLKAKMYDMICGQ